MSRWADIIVDTEAVVAATRLALRAYRALVGPETTLAAMAQGYAGPPEGLVGAVLTTWAGGQVEAVDSRRATRLFWIHLVGEATFHEWFPDASPVLWHERAATRPEDGPEPPWQRIARGPAAGRPLSGLVSPWPTGLTLAMLAHVGLAEAIVPWSRGGSIRCAPEPELGPRTRATPTVHARVRYA